METGLTLLSELFTPEPTPTPTRVRGRRSWTLSEVLVAVGGYLSVLSGAFILAVHLVHP